MFEAYGDVVTAEEAADMLRIGMNRVYVLLKSGELKAYREGRVWRISRKAIEEYVTGQSRL